MLQRLLLEADAEAGLGHRHCNGLFSGGQRHGFLCPEPLHPLHRARFHQAVARTGRQDLFHAGAACGGQHHVVGGIERLAAVVQHLRRDLCNAFHRARNVAADGVAVIQALAQAGDEPPVGAVIIHFDLLPDDALLLGDGLLSKVGTAHHAQQHIQAFVQLLGGGKQVTGAVKAGKGIGVGTGLGELCKGIAVLILKHLVFQKMRHPGGQVHFPAVHPEIPVDGAKAGGIDDMSAGIARHGPHQHRQARGQHLPLIGGSLGQGTVRVLFRHGRSPPLGSEDS